MAARKKPDGKKPKLPAKGKAKPSKELIAVLVEDGEGAAKSKGGRPSDFHPGMCDLVEKLCRLGATDEQIADFFGKSVSTINNWKNDHPEFLEAIKTGKIVADMQVANSLFKKATGYTIQMQKTVGRGADMKVMTLDVAIEPDTTAAIFWLKNRAPDRWRDKQEIQHTHRIEAMTDDELAAIAAAGSEGAASSARRSTVTH